MRTITSLIATFLVMSFASYAQNNSTQETVAVLNIDAQGFTLTPEQMGNLTRIELSKLNIYEVIDRYDTQYLLKENNINPDDCYGKKCLIDVGLKLEADKMFTGSVEVLGQKIAVSFRLIDVSTGKTEKTIIQEYMNLRQHVQTMIELTIRKMYDQSIDENLMISVSKKSNSESVAGTRTEEVLRLNGPRMGMTIFSGDVAKLYEAPEEYGGFNVNPIMFQFGYQFEVKYLNSGDFQALFEFLPIITGIDQGIFIPSFSFLNGLRNNKHGIEVAFGPVFSVIKKADGYYDENQVWHLEREWNGALGTPRPNFTSRLDSRGTSHWNTGFVFAVGKTFKSGNLNFPVNAFFIPGKSGHRYGISLGFNMVARD